MKNIYIWILLIIVGRIETTQATAPLSKTTTPRYYRFMLGDFEVTVLLDGTFAMKPGEILQGIKPPEVNKLLSQAYEGPAVITSINGFLINTGSHLVLIDTGAGGFMGPGAGRLVENLKASGYSPDQVDEIYITHMHGDHLGGLASNGKANFANAKSTLAVYQAGGNFKTFDGETELVPGVHSHPAWAYGLHHRVCRQKIMAARGYDSRGGCAISEAGSHVGV